MEPVDKAFIPNYPKLIKTSMCSTMMQQRLLTQQYASWCCFVVSIQTSSSFTSKLFLVLLLSFLETFFSCVCVNVKGAELLIHVSGDMLVLIRTMCS